MTTAAKETDLLIINSAELTENMPALINEIDTSLAKMQAAFDSLPKIVDETTKLRHFEFKDRANMRVKEFNERRMPFTRRLNDIVSLFTTREKEINRLIALTDDKTSAWARTELANARAAQEAEDAKLNAAKAKIALEGRMREELRSRITGLLDQLRGAVGKVVAEVTKENYATQKAALSKTPKWADKLTPLYYAKPTWVTDEAAWKAIADEMFPELSAEYVAKSVDILSGSLKVLDVALTNKEEAALLQQSQLDTAKAADDAKAAELAKEIEGQQAVVEMDAEYIEPPKVRTKMKLEIQDNAAWPVIFMHWYKHDPEAKTKDCRKKTFAQLITFAEKMMNTTGLGLDHPSIIWTEDVKAR